MSDQNPLLPAIAPASGGALTTATGQQRITTRMAENLLDVARSQERALAAQRRYRIGDYEFREADHAQIHRWARRLGMEPEVVVEGLKISKKKHRFGDVRFHVKDGAMVSLAWDFNLFPLSDWDWGAGLSIERLGILKAPNGQLPALPHCLRELICDKNNLTSMNLSHLPKLQKLDCCFNELTDLDLTPVPELQILCCRFNELSCLDLTPTPQLKELSCGGNKLTELDLAAVHGLQEIDCWVNELIELDLTPVPALQKLYCWFNPLTALDLTPVSGLRVLMCNNKVEISNGSLDLEVRRV